MARETDRSSAPRTAIVFSDSTTLSGSAYLAAAVRTCLSRDGITVSEMDVRRVRDRPGRELAGELRALRPDVAVVVGCQLCGPDDGDALLAVARAIPTFWWLVDEPRTSPWTVRFSPFVAAAGCHSAAAAGIHARAGARAVWLPLGAAPSVIDLVAAEPAGSSPAPEYEIGFAGALNNPARERLLRVLSQRFRLGTLLAWTADKVWLKFVEACRAVVVPPGWCDHPAVGDGHSLHSYNLAAAGIPQFTTVRPRIRTGDGLETVPSYSSPDDLSRALETMLADPTAAETRAAALERHVRADHTLRNRTARLLEFMTRPGSR